MAVLLLTIAKLDSKWQVFLFGLDGFLIGPGPVIDKVIQGSFGALTLTCQKRLIDALTDFLAECWLE